jgi:DNA-binding transcriptional ArsR family regulator
MTQSLTPKAVAALRALLAEPGSTAADLAAGLGMGGSTSNHVLVELEDAGLAHRRLGGFIGVRRQPNRWYPTALATPPAEGAQGELRDDTQVHNGQEGKGQSPPDAAPERGQPLRRGELRALILAHLREHPADALLPTAVAHALNRSAGATANALATLSTANAVVQVTVRPKTYQAVTDSACPHSS